MLVHSLYFHITLDWSNQPQGGTLYHMSLVYSLQLNYNYLWTNLAYLHVTNATLILPVICSSVMACRFSCSSLHVWILCSEPPFSLSPWGYPGNFPLLGTGVVTFWVLVPYCPPLLYWDLFWNRRNRAHCCPDLPLLWCWAPGFGSSHSGCPLLALVRFWSRSVSSLCTFPTYFSSYQPWADLSWALLLLTQVCTKRWLSLN